jgi:ribulose-phosphate 3-epimerase
LADFARAGADIITIHPEATPHAHRALQQIHELGCKAGMALNPLTPNEYLRDALPYLDLALIMSVNPGFGGQSFIEASLDKIAQLRKWRDEINPACEIEVDGGVKAHNIRQIADAGAEVFVAGSAIFNRKRSVQENVRAMQEMLSIKKVA